MFFFKFDIDYQWYKNYCGNLLLFHSNYHGNGALQYYHGMTVNYNYKKFYNFGANITKLFSSLML